MIFSTLDRYIKTLPPENPTTPAPSLPGRPIDLSRKKFGSPNTVQQEATRRSISFSVGIIALEARRWSARESVKARQWVDHVSLRAGLQVSWFTHGIDHDTPLKARLQQIGRVHGARRATTTWRGQPDQPPLVVYLAQNIDAFLLAVVELAVLFSGLTRYDSAKEENGGREIGRASCRERV